MQLKRSCFDKTIFRKNLTRFAPVWGGYALCLVLAMVLSFTNGGEKQVFWHAYHMGDYISVMGYVNLCYAALAAQLLFGDLYNSRMCNALHSLPLRRETWFVTNCVSGLVFSLIPTAVMTVVNLALVSGSIFESAWQLPLWLFLGSNLEFICFFGIAAFASMCVGNRFTMVAGYALVTFGSWLVLWLVETIYTPMLYGVVTPTALANNLSPIYHMVNYRYVEADYLSDLINVFGHELQGAVATFRLGGEWWRLWACAGAGVGFALLGLVLYRKRHLECAGDAVAFPILKPVFQVLCALSVMVGTLLVMYLFLGFQDSNFLILAVGLVVGWFIGKMLLERSSRVFRLKNWYGLLVLALILGATLGLTKLDVLNIQSYIPEAHKVKSVTFNCSYTVDKAYTDPADIENLLRVHELALVDRLEDSGTYVLVEDGSWVRYIDDNAKLIDEEKEDNKYRYATDVYLIYELNSGKIVRRKYNVWADQEAGAILESYLTQWESVNYRQTDMDGVKVPTLDLALATFEHFNVDCNDYGYNKLPAKLDNLETVESFLEAVKRDCAEGNMAQNPMFHSGHFYWENDDYEKGYTETYSLGISIAGKDVHWYVEIFADSAHSIQWLKDHGLFGSSLEVREENILVW